MTDTLHLHAGTPEVLLGSGAVLRFLRDPARADVSARIVITRTLTCPLRRTVRLLGARPLVNAATDNADADAVTIAAPGGQSILLRTADGDETLALSDVAGRPLWSRNAQGTVTTWEYENADRAGRLVQVGETPMAGSTRVREAFTYGEPSQADRNLAGLACRHHDNAGLSELQSQSLTGQPLQLQRRLLPAGAAPVDWARPVPVLEAPLVTTSRVDATGAPLVITDAAGVATHDRYDISGALARTWLRWPGDTAPTPVLGSVRRAADGRVLEQADGAGVQQHWQYEARTQRLQRHTVSRPASHPQGGAVLVDVYYAHDPAGNVLSLDDAAVDTAWRRNRRVSGERRYQYDSLYRLTSASGRERLGGDSVRAELAAGQWYPYEEQYRYDDGGNLVAIEHHGQSNWTRQIVVSARSNRAVIAPDGAAMEDDPHDAFDAGGLQQALPDGRLLDWYADGQLAGVSPVVRADGQDDREEYGYADSGTRVRKIGTQQVSGGIQRRETTYADGVEWRRCHAPDGKLQWEAIISETGNARVIRDGLSGTVHLRFAFADHLGSVGGETNERGQVISREEYYPYGGTAMAGSQDAEASDRTRGYSGKERDATGLYYYGRRYYQPDIGRWLSADPGGLIDGTNLFLMCRNNPIRFADADGGQSFDYLDLAETGAPKRAVEALYAENRSGRGGVYLAAQQYHDELSGLTAGMMRQGYETSIAINKLKSAVKKKAAVDAAPYTENKVANYTAHAGFFIMVGDGAIAGDSEFFNLPGGSKGSDGRRSYAALSSKDLFPGIRLIKAASKPEWMKQFVPERLPPDKFKWQPDSVLNDLGSYRVVNEGAFIGAIKTRYVEAGVPMQDEVERRIMQHVRNNEGVLPSSAGIPGLHAEVQALNKAIFENSGAMHSALSNTYIFTQRLGKFKKGQDPEKYKAEDFPACFNCSGIISGLENVMTGRDGNGAGWGVRRRRNSLG